MKIDIEYYYRKYGSMVLRRCRHLLYDEHSAKDAMQEVFVQLQRKQETITMEYPSSLLYRMATNTSLNMIRSKKRRSEVSHEDSMVDRIASFDDNYSRMEARSILDMLFKKEKPSTRVIAVYHFVDGLTLAETAKEMNMSVSGVRKRLRELKERVQLVEQIY